MTDVKSGDFHRLGQAVEFSVIEGSQPESVIVRIAILHDPTQKPYEIEFFAEPDTAMGLLHMLEVVRQRNGYRIPEGTIKTNRIQ